MVTDPGGVVILQFIGESRGSEEGQGDREQTDRKMMCGEWSNGWLGLCLEQFFLMEGIQHWSSFFSLGAWKENRYIKINFRIIRASSTRKAQHLRQWWVNVNHQTLNGCPAAPYISNSLIREIANKCVVCIQLTNRDPLNDRMITEHIHSRVTAKLQQSLCLQYNKT